MSKPTDEQMAQMMDLVAMSEEPLHPDLVDWVEDGQWGKMLRHPLVYSVPVMLPGHANRTYAYKRKAIAEAQAEQDWHTVVFLHERPYRLTALIDTVVGRDEFDQVLPATDHFDLVADVWVDSENIQQNEEEWRAVLLNFTEVNQTAPFLGTEEERTAFNALPDPIPAYRGGIVGDWSWTTDQKIAQFFARRSGYPVREALIPKADCFGYFTRRGEAELLVRLTDERAPLVYPDRFPETLSSTAQADQ
jgi:hypothetical protein